MNEPKVLTAFDRMQDFIRRHKQHNINDVYKLMQKRSPALHKLGMPLQVFYPSSDLIEISPFIQAQHMKGVINNNTLFHNASNELLYTLEHYWGLQLFGSWRNTLGIYRIDDDIFDDVIQSAIPDDTPANIFKNLPEWSVFVEFPHHIGFGSNSDNATTVTGFWATFDCRLDEKGTPKLLLNIVPNLTYVDDDTLDTLSYRQLQPISFYLDDGLTIRQSTEKHIKENEQHNPDPLHLNRLIQTDYKMLTHFLSCLLLLCVEEPDITHKDAPISREQLTQPKHGINKKTGAFIPPDKPHLYNIGARLGGEIRKYKALLDDDTEQNRPHTKRPHIRRGHWHGHWRGKRGTAEQKFEVKWQPAIFVNFN